MKANGGHQKGQEKTKNKQNSQEADNNTKIFPVPKSYFRSNNAVMISGFPGAGMIGSIVCAQLIEQLDMHQIAYVHSKYVMPGVLWIGGKLRHPFRIYCNKDSSVCVLTCDVPVLADAMDSISNAITLWCKQNNINKLLVASGIYPENIQPLPKDFANRSAFLIQSDHIIETTIPQKSKVNSIQTPQFSFIGGLPGQLLGNCVIQSIPCLAVLVPTLSFAPDPEGAAFAIEALGNIVPKAKVSYSQLRQEADRFRKQVSELAKLQSRLLKNNRAEDMTHEDTEQIYK